MSRPARPLVIAHRGASAYQPENTLPAYALAVEQQADMIEIDLHTTRDGAIVVTHDDDLSGLGGQGEIADASLSQVRALDAGGGESVPLLEEVLDAYGARIPFNLELKQPRRGPYPEMEARTLAQVRKRNLLSQTLFSSFFDPVLQRLRELSPEARIGLLISRRAPDGWVARARSLACEALNPEAVLVDAEMVERAHGEGLSVFPFTVDGPERMARLLELQVDGMFTNRPDRLRHLLPLEPATPAS